MDLKKQKPSKNFEDHTGYGEIDRMLDSLFTRLNPVYAYRKITGPSAQAANWDQFPESKNFEDHTSDKYKLSLDHVKLMGEQALENQGIDPKEGTAGLPKDELRRLLFQKALEEFGVSTMADFSKYPHENPMFPTIGPTAKLPRKR